MNEIVRRRGIQVLSVLIVLGAAGSLYLALTKPGVDAFQAGAPPRTEQGTYEPAALAGPAGPALRAAGEAVPRALAYDYRHLRGSLKAATAEMTDSFARDFTSTFQSSAAPQARKRREVTLSSLRAGGVVRVDDDTHVRCLLYVDQSRASANKRGVRDTPITTEQDRVVADMVLVDGTWLLDGFDRV